MTVRTLRRSLSERWPLASRPVREAARRLVAQSEADFRTTQGSPPKVIYHYTGPEGLIGIVEHGRIRATDARFFSDRDEQRYAWRLVADVARSLRTSARTDRARKLIARLRDGTWTRHLVDFYVTSFSQDGDVLSQWRGYASDGAGYAIGFDHANLTLDLEGEPPLIRGFIKVEYRVRRQRAAVRRYVSSALDVFNEATSDDDGHTIEDALFNALEPHLLAFKNPAFREEREWRAFVGVFPGSRGVTFRATARGIVPHVELSILRRKTPAIAEVVVGPRIAGEAARNAVHALLFAKGIRDGGSVRCSDAPYGRHGDTK